VVCHDDSYLLPKIVDSSAAEAIESDRPDLLALLGREAKVRSADGRTVVAARQKKRLQVRCEWPAPSL
jgi:hypothetical protein